MSFDTVYTEQQVRAYLLWLKERGITCLFTPEREKEHNPQKSSEYQTIEAGHDDAQGFSPETATAESSQENFSYQPAPLVNFPGIAAHELIMKCVQCARGEPSAFRYSPYFPENFDANQGGHPETSLTCPVDLVIMTDTMAPSSKEFTPSNQLLLRMLRSIQLNPKDYKILPLAMCDRHSSQPTPLEIAACRGHSLKALSLFKPKVILTLGQMATISWLLMDGNHIPQSTPPWNALRGRLFRSPYLTHHWGTEAPPVLGTFHPADLLRYPLNKKLAWEDLKLLRRFLDAQINKN